MEQKRHDPTEMSPDQEARFLEYMRAMEGEGPQEYARDYNVTLPERAALPFPRDESLPR